MADNRRGSPDRKLALVAPLSIAAVVGLIVLAAILFAARRPATAPDPVRPAPAAAPPAPAPPSARPQPAEGVLDRADLLDAAALFAAAYADASAPLAEGLQPGRRFALRIPFGCEGPRDRPGSAQAYYAFDPAKRTVRLVARPGAWTSLPLIRTMDFADRVEAVEGFWLPRPWAKTERCPPAAPPAAASVAPGPALEETVGLARLYDPEGSRVGRREKRPYEHVIRLGEDEEPPRQAGYSLALEGRLAAFPDGQIVRCWSETAAQRPVCVFAVELDRVAFETADGRTLAEWRG